MAPVGWMVLHEICVSSASRELVWSPLKEGNVLLMLNWNRYYLTELAFEAFIGITQVLTNFVIQAIVWNENECSLPSSSSRFSRRTGIGVDSWGRFLDLALVIVTVGGAASAWVPLSPSSGVTASATPDMPTALDAGSRWISDRLLPVKIHAT